jgi:hypothetical protein
MVKIIASEFVKRQVKGSAFSYSYLHSFEDIEKLTLENYLKGNWRKGPRDGVILVTIPSNGFVSGIVKLTDESKLNSRYRARREEEEPNIQISALNSERLSAEQVDIVLYSRQALAEGNENNDLTADYEIVSINVAPKGGVPMDPYTMARNQLKLTGGTLATYSSEEWAKAVYFWNNHASATPSKLKIKTVLWKIFKGLMIFSGIACIYLLYILTNIIDSIFSILILK